MTAAEWIIQFLASRGIDTVFTLSGGMITPLLDAAARARAPRLISMRHEQAAGFAAEGWARMSGKPGCAWATSGPGATNLLTAIGSCYFDSTPALFVTGQVPRDEMRDGTFGGRQLGFQETDIAAMAGVIAKRAQIVRSPAHLPVTFHAALEDAISGRPGPVLLDVPFDVQKNSVGDDDFHETTAGFVYSPHNIDLIAQILTSAKRPLVLVGGGVRLSGYHAARGLLNKLWIPVVHSLMAKDVLNADHPLNVGLIGSYGNRWANMALAKCDALLVLGSRLDVRQTGSNIDRFVDGKHIIHVDVDPGETRVPVELRIQSDVSVFANSLGISWGEAPVNSRGLDLGPWRAAISKWRENYPDTNEHSDGLSNIHPNRFMHALADASGPHAAAYVVDVGQHQMWAAQSIPIWNQRFITSGGMGAMGFALPAAIGAAIAANHPIVVIAGDGGFQCNIQELATVAELRLPIKMIVMCNGGHGMVRQFQDQYYEGREAATNHRKPRFTGIAYGYDIDSRWVQTETDVTAALGWLWRDPEKPALLEVIVDPKAEALPKMMFGRGLDDMEPKR